MAAIFVFMLCGMPQMYLGVDFTSKVAMGAHAQFLTKNDIEYFLLLTTRERFKVIEVPIYTSGEGQCV